MTNPDFWKHGQSYANQFSNVWAGGLAWLAQHPDDKEVRDMLMKRMKEAATGLQSPAGYFYERDGSDWGYSLSTHHSNLQIAWHYARGTAFEPLILDEVRRYYDWLVWNAVIEPDGSGFVLNRAIETRQRLPWIGVDERPENRNHSSVPEAEAVELARAFLPNREEQAADIARRRAELEKQWPNVPGNAGRQYAELFTLCVPSPEHGPLVAYRRAAGRVRGRNCPICATTAMHTSAPTIATMFIIFMCAGRIIMLLSMRAKN